MFLGIDIGSSSSKVAVLDEEKKLRAVSVVNLGTGTKAYQQVMEDALRQASATRKDILFTVATGYGRNNCAEADKKITEITCHAKGVKFLSGDARTVIDIGGQDSKVIRLDHAGCVENFVMNEKCAAGTGRFLEVMARVLGCGLEDLSSMADQSVKELSINNVCTVFAESEVISRLAAGDSIYDVARGAHVAIAKRVAGMCNRVGYEPKVVMTGGVALNPNLVEALSAELSTPIAVAPYCQGAGAVGAAVLAWECYRK